MYINTTFRKKKKRNIFVLKKDGVRLGQMRKRLLGQSGEHTIRKKAEELH